MTNGNGNRGLSPYISAEWKIRYVHLIRIGNWLIVPIYFFVVALPLYYEWRTELPPKDELQTVQGTLTFQWISGKAGTLVGIAGSSDTSYYSCRKGLFGSNHDCQHLDLDRIRLLAGKQATVK